MKTRQYFTALAESQMNLDLDVLNHAMSNEHSTGNKIDAKYYSELDCKGPSHRGVRSVTSSDN